jgi:hypothetical protein
MFLRPLIAVAGLALAFQSPAVPAGEIKQNPRVVVELFTSQGCSNCPAADAMFDELSSKPDVIGLAYHVDYWDYRGWPDTFGSEANSDRQRAYNTAWGSSRIFTPQMVVNGRDGVVASRKGEVGKAVEKAGLELVVTLKAAGDMLEISIPPEAGLEDAMVWLVSYLDRSDVKIERGENEGKTVTYSQIVVDRQVLGMWEPDAGAHFKLPLGEVLADLANGAVILVQQEQAGMPGRILGAASYLR